MKKVNLSKGLGGRLMGGLVGGAASAVVDRYLTPALPESVASYPDYVKAGLGIVLPMVVKGNQLVNSASDGLIAVAASNIVGDLLAGGTFNTGTDSSSSQSGVRGAASRMVGRPVPIFKQYLKKVGKAQPAAKRMVGKTPKVVC